MLHTEIARASTHSQKLFSKLEIKLKKSSIILTPLWTISQGNLTTDGNFFFIENFQLINATGMTELEYYHFATSEKQTTIQGCYAILVDQADKFTMEKNRHMSSDTVQQREYRTHFAKNSKQQTIRPWL